jgi:hypothetical protein
MDEWMVMVVEQRNEWPPKRKKIPPRNVQVDAGEEMCG